MSSTTYMSLTLPGVSVTPGPEWGTLLNAALTSIDSHDHSSGNGQKITQSGINITGSFSLNDQAIQDLGSCTYKNLTALLTTATTTYVKDGDLYYNDAGSNQVRITSGGSLDVSSVGGIGGDYTTTSATAVYTDAVLTYTFQDSNAARSLVDMSHKRTFVSYSSAQTLDYTTDDIIQASGNTTLTLPAAANSNAVQFKIKKTDSNATTVTIDGNASETIDGEATFAIIEQYVTVTVACNGTAWFVI